MDSQNASSVDSEDSAKKRSIDCKDQGKKAKSLKERRKPVKRTKHPENWKVNLKKNARLRGEEYVGVGGNYGTDTERTNAVVRGQDK